MKFKRLIYGSLLSLSLFTTASLFSVVAATNGIQGVYTGKECLAAEFDKITGATSYTAYIKGEDITSYQQIDSQLVRVTDDKVRVDAVGLKAGTYSLKFESNISNSVIELTDINVSADDRSGYAFFNNNDGIGAYDKDGVLKDDAVVVYVNDSNKNTVKATINNVEYTGLANILKSNRDVNNTPDDTTDDVPLDIRILDTIKTRQWDYVDTASEFGTGKTSTRKTNLNDYYYNNTPRDKWNTTASNDYDRLYENEIKSLGLNTMDSESTIEELKDLTNYISYCKNNNKDAYDTLDSYFNMLDVNQKSNITVEGIGSNAGIYQWGFTFSKCNSIEVKNLKFEKYPEDAVGFQGGKNSDMDYGYYWVHNCTFEGGLNNLDVTYENDKEDGDGSSDFKYAHNLTISYCKYSETHKTCLLGSSNDALQYNITLHHNEYDTCKARLPLVRQSNIHIYNNYYHGTTSTGISVRAKSFAFIENNYFGCSIVDGKLVGKNPFMLNCSSSYSGTTIKAIGNEFDSTVSVSDSSDSGKGLKANGIYVSSGSSYTITSNINRTTVAANSVCQPDGTTDYANFDTNSDLFYLKNNASDVMVMNNASELPALIPTVAGAGILNPTTYSITGEEEEEEIDKEVAYDNTSYAYYLKDDFSNQQSITAVSSKPSSAGIYKMLSNGDGYSDNLNVLYANNKLYIHDEDTSKTLYAYYMFDTDKISNTGIVKYQISVTIPRNSSWKFATFIGNDNSKFIVGSDSSTNLSYFMTEWKSDLQVSYTANTTHVITLIINHNEGQKSIIDIDGNTAEVEYSQSIKGIEFTTASGSRSFYVNSVSAFTDDDLKLGYQLGSYQSNNVTYNALRIIGKIEFNDNYEALSNIESIYINIKIYNSSDELTKTLNKEISNVYRSLKISSGATITETGDNLRYYYSVIKGITSVYSGYKIKASTTLNLKNGVKVECSGFVYEIQ